MYAMQHLALVSRPWWILLGAKFLIKIQSDVLQLLRNVCLVYFTVVEDQIIFKFEFEI